MPATGTPLPAAYQTVLDYNGKPVAGALIWTYLAGLITPTPTYTDATLTAQNSNPIVADASGRWVAFGAPGASYKLVFQTAAGVTIKTVDGVSAVPASAANLDIPGVAGESLAAGLVVYLSDGSGGKVSGQWYKADSANAYSSTAAPLIGMTPAAIAIGATGTIRVGGQELGLAVVSGTRYYVGTAGALTSVAPSNARVVGLADSATSLILLNVPTAVTADNGINDFRLTLTTGVPVTSADVLAATTIYCTPKVGNRIALFDATGLATLYVSAEFSIALPATTATLYDVFCYANAGVPTLELLAWTNPTTRATLLTLATTGVYTKVGDLTRRYLGSVYTGTVAGQTEDSVLKRYLWNYYQRARRHLIRQESTSTWTYNVATIRQTNASTANQVDFVVGVNEVEVDAMTQIAGYNATVGTALVTGIGLDSTTVFHGEPGGALVNAANQALQITGRYKGFPGVGKHLLAWNETVSVAAAASTFFPLLSLGATGGISAWLEG